MEGQPTQRSLPFWQESLLLGQDPSGKGPTQAKISMPSGKDNLLPVDRQTLLKNFTLLQTTYAGGKITFNASELQ